MKSFVRRHESLGQTLRYYAVALRGPYGATKSDTKFMRFLRVARLIARDAAIFLRI